MPKKTPKERYQESGRKNYFANKEKIRKVASLRHKKRLATDILYKLKIKTKNIIYRAFKGKYIKKTHTNELIGCSSEFLKKYLESKFENWMNWENYGRYNGELNYGWDIDHIIPLSSASSEEELIKLNYYTNLQPLWATTAIARKNGDLKSIGNVEKSNKILI